jgi:peptidoglycan/LPS O-acetylase OafA/YrhL
MVHDVGANAHTARDQTERLAFLDGIRGWGAMVVLVFHLFVDQGLRAKPEAGQLIHFFS